MKAKTELLLYRLLWLAEKPMLPTFRNITDGFEGWAYRNGLLRQVFELEKQGFLESRIDPKSGSRLHRLTEAGRLAVLGGRDPEARWSRKWDRKWRLFLFDIAEAERAKRRKLTRALSAAGCGCLQGSVWIAPDLPPPLARLVEEEDSDSAHLLLLLADSKGERVDANMVDAAWNFAAIEDISRDCLAVLDRFPEVASGGEPSDFDQWTTDESAAWKSLLAADPLLPYELLPKGYLGRKVWRRRKAVLAEAARYASKLFAR
jgi:DNA-binding transcriptional regulator PaaX